jgi:peroxiredoxin
LDHACAVTTPPGSLSQSQSRKRPPRAPLAPARRAPVFALRCSQYRDASLEDYRGSAVVVAFYVADWHPVCSAQLARYSELTTELQQLGAELVAISVDSVWSHMAFANARQLQFPLLADDSPRGATARAYGVYDGRRQVAKRALFVIDPLGTIVWSAVFPDAVDPGVDGILTALEGLQETPPTEGQPT